MSLRFSELNGIPEVKELEAGMDFRKPEYRREVFLRFYEFHTKYGTHPGGVYFSFPYLFTKYQFTEEEKLWFCFLNGLSQNVYSTWRLFQQCRSPYEAEKLFPYFRENYTKFGWDVDRRYVKNKFEVAVRSYVKQLAGLTQVEFFEKLTNSTSPEANFRKLWNYIMLNFEYFGRLSTFSYMEYLKIAGVDIECDTLFLDDIDGSKSHRNGLCKVLGRDDLDWHLKDVKYSLSDIKWLTEEGELLLKEAQSRFKGASYFTLESTLCCYKSWFRRNRRYPNVYTDMHYARLLVDEEKWGEKNVLFRGMRQALLPPFLLVEENPKDPGLSPHKMNWFRETGQVILMDHDWPCFKNNFQL